MVGFPRATLARESELTKGPTCCGGIGGTVITGMGVGIKIML